MSQAMHSKPSSVLGLQGFVAYALDSAVVLWGQSFEAALQEAGDGAKTPEAGKRAQDRVLRRWVPSAARYRDPAKR